MQTFGSSGQPPPFQCLVVTVAGPTAQGENVLASLEFGGHGCWRAVQSVSHPWLRGAMASRLQGPHFVLGPPFSRHPQAKALSGTEAFVGAASLASCPAYGEEGQDRELDGFFLSNTPAGAAHFTRVSNDPIHEEEQLLGVDVRGSRPMRAHALPVSSTICPPQQDAVSSLLGPQAASSTQHAHPGRRLGST